MWWHYYCVVGGNNNCEEKATEKKQVVVEVLKMESFLYYGLLANTIIMHFKREKYMTTALKLF